MKTVRLCAFTKMAVPLLMTAGVSMSSGLTSRPVLFAFAWLYLFFQGYRRAAMGYLMFFAFLTFLIRLVARYELDGLMASNFYFFLLLRMSPIFMCAHALLLSPPGEIIAALERLKLPRRAALMVVVIFRFAPTVASEMRCIGEAMKTRGLLGWRQCLVCPARSFEYLLMPLLMRTINVVDELSMAALTRGVENPGKKFSYYRGEFGRADYFFLFFMAILTIGAGGRGFIHD